MNFISRVKEEEIEKFLNQLGYDLLAYKPLKDENGVREILVEAVNIEKKKLYNELIQNLGLHGFSGVIKNLGVYDSNPVIIFSDYDARVLDPLNEELEENARISDRWYYFMEQKFGKRYMVEYARHYEKSKDEDRER